MFNKILVPLDRTRISELSLIFACDIAKAYDSEIMLMTVNEAAQFHGQIPQDIVPCWESYCQEALRLEDDSIRKYMETIYQKITSSGIKALWVTAIGRAAEEIVLFADSYDVDLIIITTHGYFRSTKYSSTSVTTEVMRGTTKPILVLGASNNVSMPINWFETHEKQMMEKSDDEHNVAQSVSSV